MIKFISHEEFPDDQYVKEIVYLELVEGHHYGYMRKPTKNGSLFWSSISCGATKNGEKKFFQGVETDSNFLKREVLAFLDARSWEQRRPIAYVNGTVGIEAYQITPSMNFKTNTIEQIPVRQEMPKPSYSPSPTYYSSPPDLPPVSMQEELPF